MNTIQRAYKTELDLNDKQVTACRRHAGAARWAYNWGLRRKQEAYRQTGKRPGAMELHRELNALKQTDVPWMYAVSKCAPQEALRNLDAAFAHFFRRCRLKKAGKFKGKLGYPRRKTRKKGLGSYPTQMGHGPASSPVIDGGRLFLQIDNEENSFLVALNAKTGDELWRVSRNERTNHSSPIVWKNKQRTESIA